MEFGSSQNKLKKKIDDSNRISYIYLQENIEICEYCFPLAKKKILCLLKISNEELLLYA